MTSLSGRSGDAARSKTNTNGSDGHYKTWAHENAKDFKSGMGAQDFKFAETHGIDAISIRFAAPLFRDGFVALGAWYA